MIFSSPRRLLRSRLVTVGVLLLVLWTWIEAFYIHRTLLTSNPQPVQRQNEEKIFLASLPWNNEIIFRTHLIEQIKDLARVLGVGNVYLSIFENGSYDGTKQALHDLKADLDVIGVRTSLVIDNTSHADAIEHKPTTPTEGWVHIDRPRFDNYGVKTGDYALRRIPYLSGLRNTVLQPLLNLTSHGETFDKIIFLNDVVFSSDDILNLLQTRNGEYAAACSLDFQSPPDFYDTFALRDSGGYPALTKKWPFFRSAASRDALLVNQPIPVQSCWNGIVVMPAAPFYAANSPLRFRGVPDSLAQKHVEASECCLIHADNIMSRELGVWMNPNVRVGYCHASLGKKKGVAYTWEILQGLCQGAYSAVNPPHGAWVSSWQIAWGLWENRLWRLLSFGSIPDRQAKNQLAKWEQESGKHVEPGGMCLIDEMQVIEPHGWMHV